MAAMFPRNVAWRCRSGPILLNRLPVTSRLLSSVTSSRPKSSSHFKTAGAVTVTGILAGIYYGYIANDSSSESLNPITFTPYILTSKAPITDGLSKTTIFTLSPPSKSPTPPVLPLSSGILSIQIKQPQLQIARSYTPLPQYGNNDLRFLIKKEPGGEMSRYLYSLKEGDVVEIRGPEVEYLYPPLEGDKVVFFAGGTGIAPALQVAGSLLLQKGDGKERTVEILWAVRHKEETLGIIKKDIDKLMSRVEAIGSGGKLVVKKFLDSDGGIKMRDVESAIEMKDAGANNRVFVSGPEGFIAWIAGPKDFRGGREEQGVLGGMLGATLQKKGGKIKVFKL